MPKSASPLSIPLDITAAVPRVTKNGRSSHDGPDGEEEERSHGRFPRRPDQLVRVDSQFLPGQGIQRHRSIVQEVPDHRVGLTGERPLAS